MSFLSKYLRMHCTCILIYHYFMVLTCVQQSNYTVIQIVGQNWFPSFFHKRNVIFFFFWIFKHGVCGGEPRILFMFGIVPRILFPCTTCTHFIRKKYLSYFIGKWSPWCKITGHWCYLLANYRQSLIGCLDVTMQYIAITWPPAPDDWLNAANMRVLPDCHFLYFCLKIKLLLRCSY